MIEFPPLKTRAPARHCLFVFSLGTALFYRFAALAATMDVQKDSAGREPGFLMEEILS